MSTSPFHLAREDRRYHWERENNRFLRILVQGSRNSQQNKTDIVSEQRDQLNALFERLREDRGELASFHRESAEELSRGLDNIAANQSGTTEAVITLAAIVARGIELRSKQDEEQQRLLREGLEIQRKRYRNEVQELRDEAEKFLQQGQAYQGPDRDRILKEALRVLRNITLNPIGQGDCVTWYKIGCLLWVLEKNLIQAEEALQRARFLSLGTKSVWHVEALRDLAEIQHLQGKHEEAYSTIHEAILIQPDYPLLFDAARYAAKAKRQSECLKLLEQCIELQPSTIITMLGVHEFQDALSAIIDLANSLVSKLRTKVEKLLTHWRLFLLLVKQVERRTELAIPLSGHGATELAKMETDAPKLDYLNLLAMRANAQAAIESTEQAVKLTLKAKIEETGSLAWEAHGKLEELTQSVENQLSELHKEKSTAEWSASTARERATLPASPSASETKKPSVEDRVKSWGCFLVILFLFGGLIGNLARLWLGKDAGPGVALVVWCVVPLILLSAKIMAPIIANRNWRLICQRIQEEAALAARLRLENISADYPKKVEDLQAIRATQIPALEARWKELLARREKVQEVLSFFQRGCVCAAIGHPHQE